MVTVCKNYEGLCSQPVAQTVVLWKSGKIVCVRDCLPIWVLNLMAIPISFHFPKQVLNNTQLGIILFQAWLQSLGICSLGLAKK
jgi:hypothetical protein